MSKLPNIDTLISEVLAEVASTQKLASVETPATDESDTELGAALRKLAEDISVGSVEITYNDLEEFKKAWLKN